MNQTICLGLGLCTFLQDSRPPWRLRRAQICGEQHIELISRCRLCRIETGATAWARLALRRRNGSAAVPRGHIGRCGTRRGAVQPRVEQWCSEAECGSSTRGRPWSAALTRRARSCRLSRILDRLHLAADGLDRGGGGLQHCLTAAHARRAVPPAHEGAGCARCARGRGRRPLRPSASASTRTGRLRATCGEGGRGSSGSPASVVRCRLLEPRRARRARQRAEALSYALLPRLDRRWLPDLLYWEDALGAAEVALPQQLPLLLVRQEAIEDVV